MSHLEKRRLLIVLWAALLFTGAACSKKAEPEQKAPAKAEGKPKIVAVQAEFDFGRVKEGVDVEHVFKIKNAGDANLQIEKARGS